MRSKNFFLAVFLSLLLAVNFSAQINRSACLNYEPQNVSLRGRLIRQTLKNASNLNETVYILKLKNPVCVNADAENEYNLQQTNVRDVQLVFDAARYRSARTFANKNVTVSGTLFGAHTQHHFTKVLLTISEIGLNR